MQKFKDVLESIFTIQLSVITTLLDDFYRQNEE